MKFHIESDGVHAASRSFNLAQPNILIAPDSYKGSIDAADVAARIAAGIRKVAPNSRIKEVAIADGGEGTAQTVASALNARWASVEVADANGDTIQAPYAICQSEKLGSFAIFDAAEIVGLPDAWEKPGKRTTRGLGQAMRQIASAGHTKIVIGLGGSSTNDAGAGLLSEVAYQFSGAVGAAIEPVLDNLHEIERLSYRSDSAWLKSVQIMGLTDVTSSLTGEFGASMIFGRQKGILDLEHADITLGNFARKCEGFSGKRCAFLPGSGAAGGLGFALGLLGGSLTPGANFILDALGITNSMPEFDWVITGEGRSDNQTLLGKGPALVADIARRHGVPVTLISGAVADDHDLYAVFDGCFSVQSGPVSLEYAMENAGILIEAASQQIAALFLRSPANHKE